MSDIYFRSPSKYEVQELSRYGPLEVKNWLRSARICDRNKFPTFLASKVKQLYAFFRATPILLKLNAVFPLHAITARRPSSSECRTPTAFHIPMLPPDMIRPATTNSATSATAPMMYLSGALLRRTVRNEEVDEEVDEVQHRQDDDQADGEFDDAYRADRDTAPTTAKEHTLNG